MASSKLRSAPLKDGVILFYYVYISFIYSELEFLLQNYIVTLKDIIVGIIFTVSHRIDTVAVITASEHLTVHRWTASRLKVGVRLSLLLWPLGGALSLSIFFVFPSLARCPCSLSYGGWRFFKTFIWWRRTVNPRPVSRAWS